MKRLIILALVALVSGCTTMESGLKAGFDMAWAAAEKSIEGKMPILEGKAMQYAKEAADKALDEACKYAESKATEIGNMAADKAMNDYRVDITDCQGYGDLLARIADENARREKEGTEPIGPTGIAALVAFLTLFQVGKSGWRAFVSRAGAKGKA